MNHPGVDVKSQANRGETAITMKATVAMLQLFFAVWNHPGVKVNMRDNDGCPALINTICNGHLDELRESLKHEGVDVNIMSNNAPQLLSSGIGKDDVVPLLEGRLEASASVVE